MARPDRDEALKEGEKLLSDWEVSSDAPVAELARWIGRSAAADLAIAERLGSLRSDESVELLREIHRSTQDKLVHKEIKRALYRLRQSGVAVFEEKVEAPAPVLGPSLEGYLSSVDGHGDQLVWIVKPRTGGLLHFFAVVNDPEGLREVELNAITRKGFRAIRSELGEKHELHLVDADWRYCDFLIDRAFHWARDRAASMKGDYPALRSQLFREKPPLELPPLVFRQIDRSEVATDLNLLTTSAELLSEKEFRTWFLSRDSVQSYLDDIHGIRESPILLNELQQKDRFQEVVERSVNETFSVEKRASYGRRLYEMAYFLLKTERPDRARQAAAVALALGDTSLSALEIPFCQALVRGSLAGWLEAASEEEAERARTSLIVTPQQFAAERRRQ
jgi:hypothetical protein